MKKARLIFWFTTVLVCFSIFTNILQDRYTKIINGSELEAQMGQVDGLSLVLREESRADAGLFAATPKIPLEKGTYKVIIRHTTMGWGSWARMVSSSFVNQDNSLGLTLAQQEFHAPGYGQIVFPLHLTQDIGDFQVVMEYGGQHAFYVHNISIMSTPVYAGGLFFIDTIVIAALVALAALAFHLAFLRRPLALGEHMQDRFLKCAPVFLVIGLGLLASYPIFNDDLTVGHDFLFHPTRLEGISAAVLDGQFPPRINPNALNQKGYATSLMYPDLLMWPFAALRVFGFSFVGTYKLVCLATNFASAAFAYLAASRMFKSRFAGGVSAVLYTFAQYRLYNLYIRDALGEAIAMAVFPLFLWGLYEVYFGNIKKWPILTLGVSCVLQAHIITSFILVLFCALFFVVFLPYLAKNKTRILPLLKAAGLTLLLNLWFIVPLVRMMQEDMHVTVLGSGFYNQLSNVSELFFDARYSYNSPGLLMYMAAAFLLAVLMFFKPEIGTKTARCIGGACLYFGGLFTFLASTLAPWFILNYVPFISANITRIQFPQRFFAVVCAFFALCGAAAATIFTPKTQKARWICLFVVLVFSAMFSLNLMNDSLKNPAVTRTQPPMWHAWELGHIGFWEYLYNGYNLDVFLKPNQIEFDGKMSVAEYQKSGTNLSFTYSATGTSYIDLPLLYYPGYTIKDQNGQNMAYTISPEKFIRIENPPTSGSIKTKYTGLWWWRISDIISLCTALACMFVVAKKLRINALVPG